MKKTAIFLRSPNLWKSLLDEYLSEIKSEFILEGESVQNADLFFIESQFCQMALLQKIKSAKNLKPDLRVFGLGEIPKEAKACFDHIFETPCELVDFTKKISEKLPLPESIDLLIIDDDSEILTMVCDYFEGRHAPIFKVSRAGNGRDALTLIEKRRPDAMILDIKMPVMTGSELYCKLQRQDKKIPTIIFFDAISAGDLDMIKKAGRPVIVEKGYRESSMSYLMATVKKIVYFAS